MPNDPPIAVICLHMLSYLYINKDLVPRIASLNDNQYKVFHPHIKPLNVPLQKKPSYFEKTWNNVTANMVI